MFYYWLHINTIKNINKWQYIYYRHTKSNSISNPNYFNVAEHVKAVHCNFILEGKLPKVGSKQMKTLCSGVKVVAHLLIK